VAAGTIATLHTSEGDIVVTLFENQAPKTVRNFVELAEGSREWTHPGTGAKSSDKLYDGTIFHRVIKGFMIQGGGMTPDLREKPTRAPIALESRNGLTNQRGTLAMARTSDPNSATAQFFINVVDNNFLDQARSPDGNGYAVFGKVIAGMDVVDKIRAVPTGMRDVPRDPVIIKKATLEK
jgi:peptidyl-prolyl cis-trans isomerase A (cyclophilin A)